MTFYDGLYDGPSIPVEEILAVYVVLNGSLGMSHGKMAAQAFHCGWIFALSPANEWMMQGRRVIVRIAETEHVFGRVMKETEGWAQRDEGLTEVERGQITAWVTVPYRLVAVPKILSHKKVQLYRT